MLLSDFYVSCYWLFYIIISQIILDYYKLVYCNLFKTIIGYLPYAIFGHFWLLDYSTLG
jgi:hypothetical protein